jgi:hypothetical protein
MENIASVDCLEADEIDALIDEEPPAETEDEINLLIGGESAPQLFQGQIEIKPSEFTEFAVQIPVAGGIEEFSFEGRHYLRRIYDTPSKRILLICGRQTEKSTGLSNVSLSYASLNVAFKVLYVTATAQQAAQFSVDRVREAIEISPILKSLTTTKMSQSVFFKQFLNRSQIRIRYAYLNADRTRGISADQILIDEVQDILSQNIPVIEQCASHSHWKLYRYSGTPKSMDNTIQIYWEQFSTQNEWAVPCTRHMPTHYNILGEKNIGKKGPICDRCGKPIDPLGEGAQWVSMQPKTVANEGRVTFEGFRIPQLMVPWIIRDPVAWSDNILFAYNRYDRAQFYNEVLGLSYDSGVRPLTRQQLMACCEPSIDMAELDENIRKCDHVYAGVDWGTAENASYTVIVLGGYIDGIFTIFYAHRFTGPDVEPPVQLDKIAKLLIHARFSIAGTDYGMGFDRNDFLARTFGINKIKKYQYVGKQKVKIKWEPSLRRYTVFRTEVMSDIFNAIKRGPQTIRFANWEQFQEPFGSDMLNIFAEYSRQSNMLQYDVSPGKSDDTFHAVLLCVLASMIERPRPDILIPLRND